MIIKYLVALLLGQGNMCCIFGFNWFLEESKKEKKRYMCLVKKTHHLKRGLWFPK